jgi:hypothetical protein
VRDDKTQRERIEHELKERRKLSVPIEEPAGETGTGLEI